MKNISEGLVTNIKSFKGIKPGYDALFVGENLLSDKMDYDDRIRVLNPKGKWTWDFAEDDDAFNYSNLPCWLLDDASYKELVTKDLTEQLRLMSFYDERFARETIFLGYVKRG